MKKSAVLLLFISLIACNKGIDNELTGTWKLLSYCKPTGTSTCTNVTVPIDKGVFISFSSRNEFNEYYQNTKPVDYSFLGCGGGSYELEDKHIRSRAGCMSSSNGQLFQLVYVTSQRLVLNPFGSGEYVFEKQ